MLRYCGFKQIDKRWKRDNFVNLKHTLRLEKDKNQLYHTMSRIGNADSLSHDTKYPIILNRDRRSTDLLGWDLMIV